MKNSITNKYAHINIVDFTNYEYEGLVLVKIRSSLWLVTDAKGDLKGYEKTKAKAMNLLKELAKQIKEVAATTNKVIQEKRRVLSGNIMKFPFGSKISAETVRKYVKKTWGGVFKLVEAEFSGKGYWGGVVEHVKSGQQFQVVRIDYVINYIRPPKGSETFDDVRAMMVEHGVATS